MKYDNVTTYISLLRGINVGGNKKIPMTDLRELYKALKLSNIQIYINSGNVIFDSDDSAQNIKSKLEQAILKKFGFDVTVMIRTKAELEEVVRKNPFKKETDGIYVVFLKKESKEKAEKDINAVKNIAEKFVISRKEVYMLIPAYGKTKLSNQLFEKKLKVAATTRNWNTVRKLLEMCKRI